MTTMRPPLVLSLSSLTALAHSPNIHVGARAPSLFRIPELDAANPAPVTRKVNRPRPTAIWNSPLNLKFMVGAVVEVNDHSLEINRPAPDAKLQGSEHPAAVHDDPIVIVPAIYIRRPEHLPSVLVAATPLGFWVSAQTTPSPEIHVRARAPTLLRIPKLYAANPAAVTRKVNLTGPTPIGNSTPNLKLVVGSVIKVNNHLLKVNRPAIDSKLKGLEPPGIGYDNPVVIPPPVDIGSPKLLPSALVASTPLCV